MSEIYGNFEDVDTRLAALAILEDVVERMRQWEAPYDLDSHFVKDIDALIRRAEEDEYIDNQIYILARCIQKMTDRIEQGEKSHD